MLSTPEMPPAKPPTKNPILDVVATTLATPSPSTPPKSFDGLKDSLRSVWSGAVTSGLVDLILTWLGGLSTGGWPLAKVFAVTMVVTALRTGLRLWQAGPSATIGGVTTK